MRSIKGDFGTSDPDFINRVADALRTIFDNPVIDSSKPPFDSVFFFDLDRDAIMRKDKNYSPGIRRMTLREIYEIERTLDENWSRRAQRAYRSSFQDSWSQTYPDGMDEAAPIIGGSKLFLTLDPRLPKKVLQAQLGVLLNELKQHPKKTTPESNFKSPDLEEWAEMDILPYIDLILIVEARGIDPPRGAVVSMISGGTKGDRRIEQSVAPLAEDLLEQTTRGQALMERLKYMAMEEAGCR